MIKTLKTILFSFILLCLKTEAASEFDWVNDSLQSGTFVQQKHLPILKRPFVTEGSYEYTQENGLSWQTTKPIPSELNINVDGVFEISSDGSKTLLTNDTRFSQLLLAIFSGNQQQLAAQFDVSYQENEAVLVPLDEQVRSLFSTITLRINSTAIDLIKLNEPNGNATHIFLTANDPLKKQD